MVVGVAAVAALSVDDDSRAQVALPSLTTPQVSTPPIGVPSLTIPPVRVQVPPVSVPGTTVHTPPVTVQTPPVTTPKVQVPSVSAPSVKAPSVSAPSAGAPSITAPSAPRPSTPATPAPRLPSLGTRRTPPAGGDGGAGPLPSPPLGGEAGRAPAGSGTAGSGAATGAGTAGSALAALGVPSAAALRSASPARRRALLRRAWGAPPLRGRKLRRLRDTLAAYAGCLDDLSAGGRRALSLRAGLGDGEPASRRAIAHRLGVSPRHELRVESGALAQLTSAGERGLCGGGALTGAGSARAQDAAVLAASQGGRWTRAKTDQRRGVLDATAHSGDSTDGGGGPSLGFVDPPGGAPSALLLLALAILGPLAVALLATRTGRASKPPRA